MEISLRQISYFLALVERRSFTVAAAALDITQPALSIAVAQLEKALGVPLFHRGSHPMRLTEFGEAFHRHALQIHHDLQNAREEVAALNNGTIGRLNLCMGPSAAGAEISAVLSSMVTDFPAAEIQVFTGVLPAVAERVRSGEFMIYLGTIAAEFTPDGLDVEPLTSLPMRVVAGAKHPLADGRPVTPADLVRHPWLAIGDLDANLPHWKRAFIDAGVAPPEPAIRVRDITLVRAMLMNTDYLTVMPLPMARPDLDAGSLVTVHPPALDWRLELRAVTRAGAVLPAAARIFLERVTSAFAATDGQRLDAIAV